MTDFEESSGNVFKDLGFVNYQEMYEKAKLSYEIGRLLKKKRLSKNQMMTRLPLELLKDIKLCVEEMK